VTNLDTSQRKVVVILSAEYEHERESGTYAARFRPLGLTAYGRSQEEAFRAVKKVFASAVETRRARGTLTSWLDRSGLDWHWYDEYEGDAPVEDARPATGVAPFTRDAQAVPSTAVWQSFEALGVAA
jgi:hypothetical protein